MSTVLSYLHYLGALFGIVLTVWVVRGVTMERAELRRLLKVGIPAPARVTAVQRGGLTIKTGGHRHLRVHLQVEVHPPGRPPYQAHLTALVSELLIPQIQPGAPVQVRVDPADPAKLALDAAGGVPVRWPATPVGAKIGLAIGVLGALAGLTVATVNSTGWGLSGEPDLSTVCGRAMACCQKVTAGSSVSGRCDNLGRIGVPETACQQMLDGFLRSAKTQGLSCE